jgi:hypothetical protein
MTFNKILVWVYVLLLASLSSSYCQNKLTGFIIDKHSNEPLSFATVGAINKPYGCYSNNTDRFELVFSNLNDSILISYMGYKNYIVTVKELQQDSIILLEPNFFEIDEVIITNSLDKPQKLELGFYSKKCKSVRATSYPLNNHAIRIDNPINGNKVVIQSIYFTYEILQKNFPLRIKLLRINEFGLPSEEIYSQKVKLGDAKAFKI